jgi:hypothetical protein
VKHFLYYCSTDAIVCLNTETHDLNLICIHRPLCISYNKTFKMAESPETVSEDYTHFQRDVTIADTEDSSNYAALHKSDRDVAYLSATRAEHAADANIPEATVDRYGYLQIASECEVETVSTLHTSCTQPDGLDVAQRPLSDYEISPYDVTVVEQVGNKVSDSSIIDNI